MNRFYIQGRLPGLNEYVDSCRKNRYGANSLKRKTESIIRLHIQKAMQAGHCHPVPGPCIVLIDWKERTRRRDVDNIEFGAKFILDAMKGLVIKDDSQKYVRQIRHHVSIGDEDIITVIIEEEHHEMQ